MAEDGQEGETGHFALRPQSGFSLGCHPAVPAEEQHSIAAHISLKQDQEIPSSNNFPSDFIN